jgi:glycosyltransferase involved in cell wall biosynthesis
MNVIHTVNSLRADHGGPSRSVTALCDALARQGTGVEIVTHRQGAEEGESVLPSEEVTTHFIEREPGYRAFLPLGNRFANTVENAVDSTSVVHNHGLWLPSNHAATRAAQRARCPLVVSARGMLSAWALGFNRSKKRLAWHIYQRRDLRHADLLHATSEAEVADIRRVKLRQPIALIPNGVAIPEVSRSGPSEQTVRRALFLSRLHPVKGLMNLVEAWAVVRPEGWELVLAGPDADGHRAEIEQAARERGVAADLRFVGEVDDEAKWDLYRSADLFVLPTFSENFGIVVAEALAAGVPAITTTGAPWQDLGTHDCGWWVEIGAEPLAGALTEAVSLSDARRRAMGQRGRDLVERKYSWDHVAEEMASVYRWLLGQGPRPDCIV